MRRKTPEPKVKPEEKKAEVKTTTEDEKISKLEETEIAEVKSKPEPEKKNTRTEG